MPSPRMLQSLLVAGTVLSSPVLLAQDTQEELVSKVGAYRLTLAKIEAYGTMMGSLADWATQHRQDAQALAARSPKGLEGTLAFLKREPIIQAQLKAHKLSEEDYLLIPMATMQAGLAILGESQGRTFPTERINPANIALVKANQARIEAVMAKVRADQARLGAAGRP